MIEMQKIPFKDGQLVQTGYVMINGVKHEMVEPIYNGETPINAEMLNQMQENAQQAINSVSENSIPRYKALQLGEMWVQNTDTNQYEYTIEDNLVTEDYLVICHTDADMGSYHTESYRGGFKIVASKRPEGYPYVYLSIQKVEVDNNVRPQVFLYVRNGTIKPILEGEDYAFSLTIQLEGTGYLYNKTLNTLKEIRTGEVLNDGEYILSKTEGYGISAKVSFIVNTKGPKVNLGNGLHKGEQIIQIEGTQDTIVKAILRNSEDEIIAEGFEQVQGYVLNEKGLNTYSLTIEDNKERRTVLNRIIIYIEE